MHVAHAWASTCGLGAARITIAPCLSLRTRVPFSTRVGVGSNGKRGNFGKGWPGWGQMVSLSRHRRLHRSPLQPQATVQDEGSGRPTGWGWRVPVLAPRKPQLRHPSVPACCPHRCNSPLLAVFFRRMAGREPRSWAPLHDFIGLLAPGTSWTQHLSIAPWGSPGRPPREPTPRPALLCPGCSTASGWGQHLRPLPRHLRLGPGALSTPTLPA